jgi:hypothetical protein
MRLRIARAARLPLAGLLTIALIGCRHTGPEADGQGTTSGRAADTNALGRPVDAGPAGASASTSGAGETANADARAAAY